MTVYGVSHIYPNMSPVGDMRQFSIKHTLSNPSFISNDFPVVLGTGGGNQPLVLDAARIGIGTTTPLNLMSPGQLEQERLRWI